MILMGKTKQGLWLGVFNVKLTSSIEKVQFDKTIKKQKMLTFLIIYLWVGAGKVLSINHTFSYLLKINKFKIIFFNNSSNSSSFLE